MSLTRHCLMVAQTHGAILPKIELGAEIPTEMDGQTLLLIGQHTPLETLTHSPMIQPNGETVMEMASVITHQETTQTSVQVNTELLPLIELDAQTQMATDGPMQATHSLQTAHNGKTGTEITMETMLTETMLMHSLMIQVNGLILTETVMEIDQSFLTVISSLTTQRNGVI